MKNPLCLVFTGLEGIFYSIFLQNSGYLPLFFPCQVPLNNLLLGRNILVGKVVDENVVKYIQQKRNTCTP